MVRGKGSKLGEPCPKVRLSLDKLPILCANVTSRKCRFEQMSLNHKTFVKCHDLPGTQAAFLNEKKGAMTIVATTLHITTLSMLD